MRALALALSLLVSIFLKPRTIAYAAAGDGPGDFTLSTFTAAGTGTVLSDSVNCRRAVGITVEVNITAVGGTPTLDVYIQHSVDGTNWDDIAHFTQIAGVIRKQVNIATVVAGPLTDHTAADGTMAANTVRQGPIGGYLRSKSVIAGTTPSFTGTIKAHLDGV